MRTFVTPPFSSPSSASSSSWEKRKTSPTPSPTPPLIPLPPYHSCRTAPPPSSLLSSSSSALDNLLLSPRLLLSPSLFLLHAPITITRPLCSPTSPAATTATSTPNVWGFSVPVHHSCHYFYPPIFSVPPPLPKIKMRIKSSSNILFNYYISKCSCCGAVCFRNSFTSCHGQFAFELKSIWLKKCDRELKTKTKKYD